MRWISKGKCCRFSFIASILATLLLTSPIVRAVTAGDTILAITDNLNVRQCTKITDGSCPPTAQISNRSIGTINSGPYSGSDNSYTWWLITWESGVVGYSVQDFIAVLLDINGVESSYTAEASPYKPDITLSGSAFQSVTKITWECTFPSGGTCTGSPYIWTPSNWTGKFSVLNDNSAQVSPTLLTGTETEPYDTYDWSVTFETGEQTKTKFFSVDYVSTPSLPGPFTLSHEEPYCDTRDPAGPAVQLYWTASSATTSYTIYRNGIQIGNALSSAEFSFTNETGLVAGTSYTYSIEASNTAGITSSNTVTITVPGDICTLKTAVINQVSPNPVPASSLNQTITVMGSNFRSGVKLLFYDTDNNVYESNAEKLEQTSERSITYQFNNVNDVGTWGVQAVNTDGASSNRYSFTVAPCEPSSSVRELPEGIQQSGCVSQGESQFYRFDTNADISYTVTLTKISGDTELYMAESESCIQRAPAADLCYTGYRFDETSSSVSIRNSKGIPGTFYIAVYGQTDANYIVRMYRSLPDAFIEVSNNAPATDEPVTFTGMAGVPSLACPIESYDWDFGDGTLGSGTEVQHLYKTTNNGTPFIARLTVTDFCGGKGTAQVGISPNAKAKNCDGTQSCSDDPVNLATGNYTYEHTDLTLPGIGIPFAFNRYYNSKDANFRNGPLGYGWTHSYSAQLIHEAGFSVVVLGDGNRETFSNSGGSYTPDPGIHNKLTDNSDGTFTLTTKQQLRYNFDTQGRLASLVDKNGNALSLQYDLSGNLDAITDTAGRQITFQYEDNRIIQITDPISRTITFGYSTDGDLLSATNPNGGTTEYTYDLAHQITKVLDPRGNTIVENAYDTMRRVVSLQKDGLGGQTKFEYNFETGVTEVIDALGQVEVHTHDSRKRIISIKDSLEHTQYFTYDDNNNRTQVIDKNGNTTKYTYDERGNVTSKTDPLGNTTTITYNAQNDPITRVDAQGNQTLFSYDEKGNVSQTTDALGNTITVTYSDKGLPLTITDARGNVTTNTYDSEGNLIQVEGALGNTTQYSYDAAGRQLLVTDSLARTTTYIYDANDNLLSVSDPLGHSVTHTYDANGNRLSTTDKNGNITQFSYNEKDLLITTTDALGGVLTNTPDALDRVVLKQDKNGNLTRLIYDPVDRLIGTFDALGNELNYFHDANGNLTAIADASGDQTHFTYDKLNRRTKVIAPLEGSTTTTYDALGRVISTTNAKGQTTTFEYDALGHLTKVTDANGGIMSYTYDENGNRLSMTDTNGNKTLYSYDALNRISATLEPLGNATKYQYDAVGNLSQLTKPDGIVITYTYDDLDRISTITYPDASTVQFTYDVNGNRITQTDSLGTQSYTYDALYRITSHNDPFGNVVGYSYDANGNRTSLTYPGNKVVTYDYDVLNRMSTVTDWLGNTTQYTYDNESKLIQTALPNGTNASYVYDKANRLISLTNAKSNGAIISSHLYTLDILGNHTHEEREEPFPPIFSPGTTTYTYDAENRLTNVNGVSNTFNNNGSMTAKGTDTYAYDFADRLMELSIAGTKISYKYDGVGNRYIRTQNSITTRFTLDTNTSLTNILAETDSSNSINAYNVYGLGLIARIEADDTAHYYHYDSTGNTVALTNESGTVTDQYAYNPFGGPAGSIGNTDTPFTYLGFHGITNEVDGLFYVRARYYDSDQQRFLSKDTKPGTPRNTQSMHRYIYAVNNPIILIDISGFSPKEGKHDLGHQGNGDCGNNSLMEGSLGMLRNLFDGLCRVKEGNYAIEVADAATEDGRLGLYEANKIWRVNTDPNFTVEVDATKLTVKQVKDFEEDGRALAIIVGPFDWVVHGSVTLYRNSNGEVEILDGPYDFNMHEPFRESISRNFLTTLGRGVASYFGAIEGEEYIIHYSGTPEIIK
ncbi:DUF6531 domain-containing protein [Hahella sp. CR1]|uniref:DUF6531 domain-containing protein n=1 Tax=Hahella sp. CR1 TaxID=2992807 RepID=UPI002441035C|nr:DUF6531 domain-containing protein [Hahella sp. CR1]MDG9667079.1 DUF6531 domain-containing protein [Hahella sp. CR1]